MTVMVSEKGLTATFVEGLKKSFKSEDALMTLLVICILESRFISDKAKWNIIVKKSLSFVKGNLNEGVNLFDIK